MSQKPDLQVNAHNGIGAWECPGRCLIKLLPERQGAISVSLPVLYFGSSVFSSPTTLPRSSDPFAPLFGKSPTHRDWQYCNWCLTHLASFLSEFDRSVNDSLFSPPCTIGKPKATLERVVQLYLSFLIVHCYGKYISHFKLFSHFCPLFLPPHPNSQYGWETSMLRIDYFSPSEGIVMTVETSLSVDLSKYWQSHLRPSTLSS